MSAIHQVNCSVVLEIATIRLRGCGFGAASLGLGGVAVLIGPRGVPLRVLPSAHGLRP